MTKVEAGPVESDASNRAAVESSGGVAGLVVRVFGEADPSARRELLARLAAEGSAEAVEGLLCMLAVENSGLRAEVVQQLRSSPALVEMHLSRMLAHPDPAVRLLVVNLCHRSALDGATDELVELIRTETDVNVVGAALDVLAELGDASLAETIREVLARFADEPCLFFVGGVVLKRLTRS